MVNSTPGDQGSWRNVRAGLDVDGNPVSRYLQMAQIPTASSEDDLNTTFNFLLNYVETVQGTRNITVTLISAGSRPENNLANNSLSATLTFGPARYLNMRAFRYTHTGPNGDSACRDKAPAGTSAPWEHLEFAALATRDVTPFSDVQIIPVYDSSHDPLDNSHCNAFDPARVWAAEILDRMYPDGAVRAPILQPENNEAAGCSCWGSNGNRLMNIKDWMHTYDHLLAEELTHSYPGVYACCHTWDSASGYPRPIPPSKPGWLGPFVSVEFYTSTVAIAGSIPSEYYHAFDYMSYNQPDGASPYTYCKMLNYTSGGSVYCPSSVEGGGPTKPSSGEGNITANTNALQMDQITKPGVHNSTDRPEDMNPYLYVTGWISDTGEAGFSPFEIINSSIPISASVGTAYTLKLLDGGGNTLRESSFDLIPQHSDPPRKGFRSLFSAYMLWDINTASITLQQKDNVLAKQVVSKHTPTVMV